LWIWDWKRYSKKRYHSGICLQELKKTTEIISQDRRFPARDSNRAPPEYNSALTCSVGRQHLTCPPHWNSALRFWVSSLYLALSCSPAIPTLNRSSSSTHWSPPPPPPNLFSGAWGGY
jgi:hypothetical protein